MNRPPPQLRPEAEAALMAYAAALGEWLARRHLGETDLPRPVLVAPLHVDRVDRSAAKCRENRTLPTLAGGLEPPPKLSEARSLAEKGGKAVADL
jgi:hypothetical protein